MSDRIFLDTNVLVYCLDDSEPEKQKQAQDLLASPELAGAFVVSTQVLQELYVALTRGADPIRSPAQAQEAVREAAKLIVVQVDPQLILEAIAKSQQQLISFWDALVVQAAEAAGCSRLISEDLNDGQAIGTVRIDNPFRTGKSPKHGQPTSPKGKRKAP
jgi:predicted nucleic acid-binding protein